MKHFDLVDWSDFVRELAPLGQRSAMQQHLAAGCSECHQMVDWLNKVVAAAAEVPVPQPAVRHAKALFAPERLGLIEGLTRVAARLVFDAFRDPLPQGLRSGGASRQVLYEAGDLCLDLRLERDPDQGEFSLIGQIASSRTPDQQLAGVPVLLFAGNRLLVSAASNQFGEFHIEHRCQRNLRLCVPIFALGKRIEVGLNRMLDAEASAAGLGLEGGVE